jgi:hypothetical protein
MLSNPPNATSHVQRLQWLFRRSKKKCNFPKGSFTQAMWVWYFRRAIIFNRKKSRLFQNKWHHDTLHNGSVLMLIVVFAECHL